MPLPPLRPEDAIRYAFAFLALLVALVIGLVGVVVYFANSPKTAAPPAAPIASSSTGN